MLPLRPSRPRGHCLRGSSTTTALQELALGGGHRVDVELLDGTVSPVQRIAAAAVRGPGVVELFAQETQPTAGGGLVRPHGVLLGPAGGGQGGVAGLVVGPRLVGAEPGGALAVHGALHVEHLEQGLEAAPSQVHQ
jgi:hypothetical protein